MTRSGFSAVELMIVIILIGLIAAVGFPKIHGVLDKTNVRSARVAVGTYVVTARSLPIQRGGRAAVPFAYGASSRGGGAACRAGPGTIRTVGQGKNRDPEFN